MQGLYRDKYRIKSTRLKDFDYASNGAYFVTMCTKNRECHFGHVINGEIKLSDMGKIVEQCWDTITNHFTNVVLDEFIVMPNHVHGVIIIDNDRNQIHDCRDVACNVSTKTIMSRISPKSYSLSTIVRSFKSAVSRWCHQNDFEYFAWQPRFYEHVIRNDEELNRIRQYIINNPVQWELDDENPKNCRL